LVSHTAETQARAPRPAVHVPPGTGSPFDTFGWHWPVPERSLHQLPAPHSASVKQTFPHAPVDVLQNGPGCVPVVQSTSVAHFPQVPAGAQ
jgi:hypothetical protein